MSQRKQSGLATANVATKIEEALEHFTDPHWLGANSPLAKPYFLGERLLRFPDANTDRRRGKVLRVVLLEAAATLNENDQQRRIGKAEDLKIEFDRGRIPAASQYEQHLLRYLEAGSAEAGREAQTLLCWIYFSPLSTMEQIADKIGIRRETFFRWRREGKVTHAIARLSECLLQQIKPTLRLETPVLTADLVGRDDPRAACLAALEPGQSLALVGPSGIGKSALGADIAHSLVPRPAFWYTCCRGLNDRLRNLLFEFGYFLFQKGAGSLWLQLNANQETLDVDKLLGLIRYDLATLTVPPLLCFDEVDLLRSDDVHHALILVFIERLAGEILQAANASLLVIGQQVAIEHIAPQRLESLTIEHTTQLLARAAIAITLNEIDQLYHYTHGNPRLLTLFTILHRAGEPLAEVLKNMQEDPSLPWLIDRILRRLPEEERNLLASLSVFRRATPQDAWETPSPDGGWQPATLAQLSVRELVHGDGRGAVAVLLAFRAAIYDQIDGTTKQALHLYAAAVRATRAEYTAAAFHYLQAEQPQLAVALLDLHQTEEINQGQSETALALLDAIDPQQLQETHYQEIHRLLRARLKKLAGAYRLSWRLLRERPWDTPYLQLMASRLEGDIADLLDDFDGAIVAYEASLQSIHTWLGNEAALLHKSLSRLAMRQKDFTRAWHEAQLASYEVEEIQAEIQDEMGNYAAAKAYYREALKRAEQLSHTYGEAKTRNHLASLLVLEEAFNEAIPHAGAACQLFERLGNVHGIATSSANLAFAYNQLKQPRQAIPPAEKALDLFTHLREPWGRAVAAQNLAEAYLALEETQQAESYAWHVINAEERATLPDGLRVMALIKAHQQQFQAAEMYIDDAIREARQNEDRYLEAYARRDAGTIYCMQGNIGEAVMAFDRAIQLFEELELPNEVARTRVLRAVALEGHCGE